MRAVHPRAESITPAELLRGVRDRAREILASGNDQGSSIVEFGLMLPPMLLVVTGIMVIGVAMNNYVSLNNAVSIGARDIAISRGQTTDPCKLASNAIIAATPTFNSSNLTFSYTFNGNGFSGTTCSSTSTTTGAAGDLVQGQPITVNVTYPCALGVYGRNYATSTCYLTSQFTELVQ